MYESSGLDQNHVRDCHEQVRGFEQGSGGKPALLYGALTETESVRKRAVPCFMADWQPIALTQIQQRLLPRELVLPVRDLHSSNSPLHATAPALKCYVA